MATKKEVKVPEGDNYVIVHAEADYGRGNTTYGELEILGVYQDYAEAVAACKAIGYGKVVAVVNPVIKAGKAFMPR